MNKKTIIIVIILSSVIIAGLVYTLLSKKEDNMSSFKAPAGQKNETDAPKKDSPSQTTKGAYVDYSEDAVTSAKGTKLLFFYAAWCPQCRELEASIKNSQLPDGLTIFKVDYDSNQALRAKYGVTIQTTVVRIDDSLNKLSNYVAYDKPTFESVKEALLE